MSKLACKNCKSIAVEYEDYCGGTSYYRCKTCGQRGSKDKFTQLTLFDSITQSQETLAENLVEDTMDGTMFYSILTREDYCTKERAIAATVAKLKEVCND